MKIKQILEKWDDFDEHFIRSVAKDRGIDLSDRSTDQIRKMHNDIVRNIDAWEHDEGNLGAEYYDMAKQYFS